MSNYILTRQAQSDIDEIVVYIAADDLDAAISFADRLSKLFELLAKSPKIGRERPELQEHIRSIPIGNYVVFYRPWAGKTAIVRVLHGTRDLDPIFSD